MPFPDTIPLDQSVYEKRASRRSRLIATARKGALLRAIIILVELFGVIAFGSSALFLDALSGGLDLLSSLAIILCIHVAAKPPDRNHPLGHGRFEPISGLLLGFLILIIGVVTTVNQALQLGHLDPTSHPIEPHLFILPLLSLLLLEGGYQTLRATAKKERSSALLADAVHYRIDAIASVFALIALGLGALFPSHSHLYDHIGALFIAMFMVVIGLIAAWKNIHQLLDRAPPEEEFDRVRKAALSVPGVLATEKLRLQVYGPDAHVAIDIEVDPHLTVASSHRITQRVRRAIQASWPNVRDVIVHVEPYYPGDHHEP